MMTDDHFHLESLEQFTTVLGSVGFQLVADSTPPRWRGKIHPAFAKLTDAATMDIVITPGWPFQPPAVFVQGLNTSRSTLGGFVCMWQDGDFNHDWTTVEGLFSRIEEWCEKAKHGWDEDHLESVDWLTFFPSGADGRLSVSVCRHRRRGGKMNWCNFTSRSCFLATSYTSSNGHTMYIMDY